MDNSPSPADGADHVHPLRVYFEDTDVGGAVYYANYLKYAERARTEMLRAAGIDHGRLMDEEGIMFMVRRCETDYLNPARLDDALEVHTTLLDVRGASLWMSQVVRRGEAELARLRVRLACVSTDGRPARIPGRILAVLKPFGKIRSTPSRQLQQRV